MDYGRIKFKNPLLILLYMRDGALGIISEGDRFLLAMEAREKHPAFGTWRLIGGKVESGETPTDALKREFMEELGVSINVDSHFSTEKASFFDGFLHIYSAGIIAGEPRAMNEETSELRWFTREEVAAADKMDSLSRAVINRFADSRK
jgi:8-oxo-dGTP diphosphatase